MTRRPPLLAIAHGSQDPRHAETIERLATAVRRIRPDLTVETAYLDHCAPSIGQVVDRLAATGHAEVVAVPLLLTAAYHAKTDIPAQLRAVRQRHPQLVVRYARPLGPDPLLVAALERRLREAGVWPGEPSTTVVLASAGSSDPEATAALARLARDWQERGWRDVLLAYASASPPTVAQAVTTARRHGARHVAVASYFLAPGFLPDRIVAGARQADVVTEVLGPAPEVAKLVARRYADALAAAWTRRSA
ncbi:cobalamin biosynthesis protein CbiX [Carbonactinospora thermoautotrophica]|uniref:sirohydrochlorin chelatase n=1 Tax=Carbonactinospora thermoautotrophica TaxID=1469144 RepID=UPI00227160C6|nr:sirohydrochlorin chelatase [Carbonactinospora thermoautotrophica]MCX9191034.1 cobalamin biosynthesis protein CbiX [Carbonactinospora thermoautotrophica]